MIKLLVGITLSEIGGSQKVVFDIITNLPEDRFQITLLTSPKGELLDWVKEINRSRANPIRIIAWDCLRREIAPWNDLKALFRFIRLLRKEQFDVAHFHNSKMGLLGRLAARFAHVPKVLYTVHGWGLNPENTGRFFQALSHIERFLSRFTTAMIFVSKQDMEQGIKNRWASPDRSHLIYNGIRPVELLIPSKDRTSAADSGLRSYLNVPDTLPVIGFVARLAEPKNPLFAIHVSDFLLRRGLDHRLCIIGDGPKFEDCEKLIEALDRRQQILLLGTRNDVRDLLLEMDVFCLYSKWEGLPISILEAMHSGLPVVASRVGGIPEMLSHGESGYLLDDTKVETACQLISSILCSEEERQRMGTYAKAVACDRFLLSEMVSEYQSLYEMA